MKQVSAQFSTYVGTTALGAQHFYVDIKDGKHEWKFSFLLRYEAVLFVEMLQALGIEIDLPDDWEEYQRRADDEHEAHLNRKYAPRRKELDGD